MSKLRTIVTKVAIACAFYDPLVTAISAAIAAYYLMGATGVLADVGRLASLGAALYAVTTAAKMTRHVVKTGELPR